MSDENANETYGGTVEENTEHTDDCECDDCTEETETRFPHALTFTLGVLGGCILICLILGLPLIQESVSHRVKHTGYVTVIGERGGWVLQRPNREIFVAKLTNQAPVMLGDKIKDISYRDAKDGMSDFVSMVKDESDGRDKYPAIIVLAPGQAMLSVPPGWTINGIAVDPISKTVKPSAVGCAQK